MEPPDENKLMKTAIIAISVILLSSAFVATGLHLIFGFHWIGGIVLTLGMLYLYSHVMDRWVDHKILKTAARQYEKIPYKKYRIKLLCQACGNPNIVELDLNNTEFPCRECSRKNAIYINFSTAVISEPLYDAFDHVAVASGDVQEKLERKMKSILDTDMAETMKSAAQAIGSKTDL